MEVPLGCRFQPHDYDLLRFLFDFVTGRSDDYEGLIHQEDVFGDKEPWELFRRYSSEKMAYFFTRLKKKSKKCAAGKRFERRVGKRPGHWHGQDRGKVVVDEEGAVAMGHVRSFVYNNPEEPDQDGQWLLKEFYLPETILKRAMARYPCVAERKDFVLCRLRRKKDENEDLETSDQGTSSISVPSETLQIVEVDPVETLPPPQPAADADDISLYFDGGLGEALPEPPTAEDNGDGQYNGMFMEFEPLIWNTDEDVTALIDFDFPYPQGQGESPIRADFVSSYSQGQDEFPMRANFDSSYTQGQGEFPMSANFDSSYTQGQGEFPMRANFEGGSLMRANFDSSYTQGQGGVPIRAAEPNFL